MKMINGRYILFPIVVFISFFFSISAHHASEEVTDKELSILASLSYYNNIDKNVAEMIKINDESLLEDSETYDWDNWEVVDYVINTNRKCFGFSCFTFKKGSNIVIVPRGTDGGIFYENWRYLIPRSEHPQAQYMRLYVINLFEQKTINSGANIYLTGHSLGGYLSLYGTGVLLQIQELKDRFVKVVTFNGLGLGAYTNTLVMNELYSVDGKKIINYRIKGDLVSYIGTHITPVITLPPKPKQEKFLLIHSIVQFLFRDLPSFSQKAGLTA